MIVLLGKQSMMMRKFASEFKIHVDIFIIQPSKFSELLCFLFLKSVLICLLACLFFFFMWFRDLHMI